MDALPGGEKVQFAADTVSLPLPATAVYMLI